MPSLYLLDTNTVSYFVKGNHPELRTTLLERPVQHLAISAITEAELRYWVANRPNESRLRILIDDFVARVPSLPWNAAAANVYGGLRARLKMLGRPIAELDLLIAAHAIALDAILITHDKAFVKIPGLRTDDWVDTAP